MSKPYNIEHWRKKVGGYLGEAWASKPSPFVKLVQPYIKPNSNVLELGTGAGQDGLWLESQGYFLTLTDGDDSAFAIIQSRSINDTHPIKFDITQKFPFEDNTFDAVYAQLVLHYFDDKTMYAIIEEIKRVLKNAGLLAIMVNTVEDPEYKNVPSDGTGILETDKLTKRYFTVETLKPFVKDFEPLLFNAEGRTPKDDAVSNSGMIQFIGKLKV